jgi:hypothetical protein
VQKENTISLAILRTIARSSKETTHDKVRKEIGLSNDSNKYWNTLKVLRRQEIVDYSSGKVWVTPRIYSSIGEWAFQYLNKKVKKFSPDKVLLKNIFDKTFKKKCLLVDFILFDTKDKGNALRLTEEEYFILYNNYLILLGKSVLMELEKFSGELLKK